VIFPVTLIKLAHKSVDLEAKVRNFGVNEMEESNERRTEKRLRYYWPIWFAEDVHNTLSQGQMVDISSRAAAFTCHVGDDCPNYGQQITARFSVPRYGSDGSFDMANFTRSGYVYRIDNVNSFMRRVVVQFADPLPFRPGEQESGKSEAQQALEPVMV
jgi:hypothetical protein